MKYTIILILSAIFILAGNTAAQQTLTANLSGAQVSPPNVSEAVGAGSVILNEAETSITVTLYLSGLGSIQTSAGIYNAGGDAVFNLPNGNFSQNFPVTPVQAAELKIGRWSFIISSKQFPGGELRGRISPISMTNAAAFPFSNGALDANFGTRGIVTTDAANGGNSVPLAVAVQPDGKLVVAGFARRNATDDFAVARYNPNGTLDTGFGSGGTTVTPIGAGDDDAYAVALQPDGKILLAGITNNGANIDAAFVRYNSDGALDPAFDGDGIVTTPIGSSHDFIRSVAVQSDGKIAAAGSFYNGAATDLFVLRYNPNGTLDTDFDGNSGGGNGIVTTAVGSGNDFATAAAIQQDGKIVVTGYYYNGANNDTVIIRYNTDGVLDTSFDGDGIAGSAVGAGTDEAFALALQPDGKIVIAGCVNLGGGNDFLLVRYNSSGSPDSSFGTNGVTMTPIGNSTDIAQAVAVQSDGKIVAAGFSNNGANNDFTVIRRNSDGTLDTSFGSGGKLTTPVGSAADIVQAMAIQADGKIVVAGRAVFGAAANFAIARYGYGTNAATNDGSFSLNQANEIRFDNAFRSGRTVSAPFNSLALLPLPSNYNLLIAPRVLQTSALFSGDVTVKFKLPARIDEANFNAARILQFENGMWIDRAANAPPRDFASRTIYARVSSLGLLAVVSPLGQTAENVMLSGKITSANGKAASGAIISLTDAGGQTRFAFSNPFGYYRFRDVALRGVYTIKVRSKRNRFATQILVVNDESEDLNLIAEP